MKDRNGEELPKGISIKKNGYEGRFQYQREKYWVNDSELKTCVKKLNNLRYEVEHSLYTKKTNYTVDQWFIIWIREYKSLSSKEGTVQVYEDSYRNYIKKMLGSKKIKDISSVLIQKLYNDLFRNGYSTNTIEIVASVINGMYKQALRNKMIQDNPASLATIPRNNTIKKERRVMSSLEQNLLLDYAKGTVHYNLYLLSLATGMRSGEVRGLEWSDVDFKKKTIHVTGTLIYVNGKYKRTTPKTLTSNRNIPMLDSVATMLKQQKQLLSELKLQLGDSFQPKKEFANLIFYNEHGDPINRDRYRKVLNSIIKKINQDGHVFPGISPHTFRHTFATRCIEQGMKPNTLKTILGHSKLSMTMDLYAHVMPDDKSDEMQKIAFLFA